MFGEILKQLRTSNNLTQSQLGKKLKISASTVGMYEQNRRTPDIETLNIIAELFDVSTDYLLGRSTTTNSSTNTSSESSSYELNSKDEKDIAKKLESIVNSMNSEDGLMLYNSDLDEETKELLIASIERTLRQAKLIAKEKFTPKKYKK